MGKKGQNHSNFIVQGSILAVASIVVRMIGLVYRIPLTHIIGDDGNGYYGSAFEVYSIILLLSSYSLPLAVSKLVSARMARGQFRNAYRIYQCAMTFAFVVGSVAALLTFIGADFIAGSIMAEPMSAIALRVLAPTILIVAVMGVMRGFFQGLGTMMPTAVSQIIEQIINAIISVLAAWILFSYGSKISALIYKKEMAPALGAAGGTLGTSLGALSGMLFLGFIALIYKRVMKKLMKKDHSQRTESYASVYRILIITIVPVLLSTAVYNVSNVIDQGIFSNVMAAQQVADKTSLWGVYTGKYRLLTNVPIAIANAMAASLIPSLTAAVADRSRGLINSKINTAIRFVMLVALPSAVGFGVLASPIMQLLFNDAKILPARLLQVGCLSIVFYSLSTLTNGILQGIDKMRVPVINALIALVLHIGLLLLLLLQFKLNIYAVVYANLFFAFVMCLLNGAAIKRYVSYQQEIVRTFIIPGAASVVMGIAVFLLYKLFMNLTKVNSIATILSIFIGAAVYFIILILTKGITAEELYRFPGGKKLVQIARIFHLM